MKKIVIIGAGPIGLFLAHQLHQAGVQHIVVVDTRAGRYTRPGHLDNSVFEAVSQSIGEPITLNKIGHIKDLERILFERVKAKVQIEQKSFAHFSKPPQPKGVVVSDQENNEELIECDYVFDCSGSQRAVIHEVNRSYSNPPFVLNEICKQINIKSHFLAYVKMKKGDFLRVALLEEIPPIFSAIDFARALEKVRALGWKEFSIPYVYGADFGEGKKCLYMECADDLNAEDYDQWVHAVLNGITNSKSIQFEKLPQSKKYGHKPRFTSFRVNPVCLNRVSYQAEGLPMVVAMGDAQIDPYYYLSHGVINGLKRVESFIEAIGIHNGCIVNFDENKYSDSIKPVLKMQRASLKRHYANRAQFFIDALTPAAAYYRKAVGQTSSDSERTQLQNTLQEIEGRLAFEKAKSQCGLAKSSYEDEVNLVAASRLLVEAKKSVPESDRTLHVHMSQLMLAIAARLKMMGTIKFKTQKFEHAYSLFKHALEVYQNPLFKLDQPVQELKLYSNLIVCCDQFKPHSLVISMFSEVLTNYPNSSELIDYKKEIVADLVRVFKFLMKDNAENAAANSVVQTYTQFEEFITRHAELIGEKKLCELRKTLMPKQYTQMHAFFQPEDRAGDDCSTAINACAV